MEDGQWDVIVIGGGAAGLSAAQMLGRARRRTLLVDAGAPRNRFASEMHGVLGHDGIPPAQLLARGRAEIAAYGVETLAATVERVDETDDHVTVLLGGGEDRSVTARAIIVATGLADDLPAIPGLGEHWGRGVLHCPYCHGWEVRDRMLGVLLTSPLGLHQAELVRQWSDRIVVFAGLIGALDPQAERRLRARGIEIVSEPVTAVVATAGRVSAVQLRDGREVAVDAVFTMGAARPLDGFLAHLGLERTDTPMGGFLAVDAAGRTSARRIWAAGNVVNPAANVPMAMGAGAFTGAQVNAALVAERIERALAIHDAGQALTTDWPAVAPADFWEDRYAGASQVWSGRPNQVVVDVASRLEPGRSLDLGCGEGADAIWLAEQGWDATGIDVSPTAIARATAAARAAGVAAQFVATDLSTWNATDLTDGDGTESTDRDGTESADRSGRETYDLVTASFLHSPVALDRPGILRRAVEHVAPGGHLLIVSHAGLPPWAAAQHGHEHDFLSPDEEIAALGLDPAAWTIVLAESRPRIARWPDGEFALDDAVVLLRRSAAD